MPAILIVIISTYSLAETIVYEGKEAKNRLSNNKDISFILEQNKKTFHLKQPGNANKERKPDQFTIKVNEEFYITNEENRIIHNVYDVSDDSWVLTKQLPGEVAAVSFGKPGIHELKCAIHPKMNVKIIVEQ